MKSPVTHLFDTNIVSYVMKRSVPGLAERFYSLPKLSRVISAITEAELHYGLAKTPLAINARNLVTQLLTEITVVAWDSSAALAFGKLRAAQEKIGRPIHTLDLQIAAHALALGAILVTRDRVFHDIPGLACEDWTQS